MSEAAPLHPARFHSARMGPLTRTRVRTPTRIPTIDPRRAAYPARWHTALDGRVHPTLQAWAWRLATLRRQLEEVRCLRALARRRLAQRGLAAAFGFLGAQRNEGPVTR